MNTLQELVPHEIIEEAKKRYNSFDTAHDWTHINRVVENAEYIAHQEQVSDEEKRLALVVAFVHDLDDPKCSQDFDVRSLLKRFLEEKDVEQVLTAKKQISFSNRVECDGINVAAISQDADRLDAIGAIGVARCYVYSGAKNKTLKEARQHFDDKLLKVPSMMNTATAKSMAHQRLLFMQCFLQQLHDETE